MPLIQALYVHLPFCHRICPFCAFAVHGNRPALHTAYLGALQQEIRLLGAAHSSAAYASSSQASSVQAIASIYIGGGTPSTLSLPLLARLFDTLRTAFAIAPDAQWSFELNPEDVSAAYLNGLHELGVSRLSLGLQSLDDGALRALGRNNTAASGRTALDLLRDGPIDEYNVDLLLGAPGIPLSVFHADVEAMATRGPPHLSLYALDVEPGTLFARDAAIVAATAAARDAQAEALLWAAGRLTAAGYRHYEVSNFCRPGHEGRQNLLVWDGADYLGMGMGAHSHVNGERWWNERHLRAYQRTLAAGRLPITARERLTPVQQVNEMMMLALRRAEGLDVLAWESAGGVWDEHRQNLTRRLIAQGQARLEGTRLALTETGLLLADGITEALMLAG